MVAAMRRYDMYVTQETVCTKEETPFPQTDSTFSLPYIKDSGMQQLLVIKYYY